MRLKLLFLIPALLAAKSVVTPIEWAALPALVQTAANKYKLPSGARVNYVKIVRASGEVLFEMKVNAVDGRDQEILFRPDGRIAETEETVPIASIPAPARAAIEKETRNGKIIKVERLRRDGKVFYEGEYMENGEKKASLFDASGKRVE